MINHCLDHDRQNKRVKKYEEQVKNKYNAADNALAAASLETNKKGTPSPLLIHSLSHLLRIFFDTQLVTLVKKKIFLIHSLSNLLEKKHF